VQPPPPTRVIYLPCITYHSHSQYLPISLSIDLSIYLSFILSIKQAIDERNSKVEAANTDFCAIVQYTRKQYIHTHAYLSIFLLSL